MKPTQGGNLQLKLNNAQCIKGCTVKLMQEGPYGGDKPGKVIHGSKPEELNQ